MATEKAISPFTSVRIDPSEGNTQDGLDSPGKPKKKKSATVAPTFDDVLYGYECPCTRREFREYLSIQRADEMIDFFETVETYVKTYAELSKRKGPRSQKVERTNTQTDLESQDQTSGIFESARSNTGQENGSGICKVERGMDILDYATVIVNQFVVSEAPREINISSVLRDKFLDKFKDYDHQNQPPVDLFDGLQTEMRSMLRGAFPPFLQYISTQNVSEAHVFHRAMYGTIYFFVLVGALLAMILTGINPLWRIAIITFWQGPLLMWASAYFRLCDGLSRLGVRMTKDEWDVFTTIFRRRKVVTNKLTNEWARQRLLKRSTKLELATALAGLCIGVCTLFIPPGVQSL